MCSIPDVKDPPTPPRPPSEAVLRQRRQGGTGPRAPGASAGSSFQQANVTRGQLLSPAFVSNASLFSGQAG